MPTPLVEEASSAGVTGFSSSQGHGSSSNASRQPANRRTMAWGDGGSSADAVDSGWLGGQFASSKGPDERKAASGASQNSGSPTPLSPLSKGAQPVAKSKPRETSTEEHEDQPSILFWLEYYLLWPWNRSIYPVRGILLNEESKHAKIEARMRARQPVRVKFRLPKKQTYQGFHLLDSHSVAVQRWQRFMVIVLAYEIWAFPFRLAFGGSGTEQSILAADAVSDVFFLADMAVQLCTIVPPGRYPLQDDALTVPRDIARAYLRFVFPLEIFPSVVYYAVSGQVLRRCGANGAGRWCWMWWASALPRSALRGRRMANYFTMMESDLKVSVRTLQAIKFSLILFLSAHSVGCLFYWMARLQGLQGKTWVAGFEALLPQFDRLDSSIGKRYLMCIYRGFNSLSNLQYDVEIHRNPVEMIWSMLVMGFQVYMSALILGTLLNYLVTKDPVAEAHKKRLEELSQFADAKVLPTELRERILKYRQFQHRKNVQNKAAASMDLPQNLMIKVADSKYRAVIDKCTSKGGTLFSCDKHFLNAMIVKLKVVHLMPGEEFVAEYGIPRELYFVLEGTVHVVDGENRVVRAISNDVGTDTEPICGEVPFFLGISHTNSLRARRDGDVQLLVIGRAEMDQLLLSYPSEHDRITENLLAGFGLDPEGNVLDGGKEEGGEGERERAMLREEIVRSIRRRRGERFASLVFAANSGDLETVAGLLAHGADVNQINYDGRTILHDACAEGNYRLAEMLLEHGADTGVADRWGATPMAEALANKHAMVSGLLSQWKARLAPVDAAELLCAAASVADVDALRRLIESHVDPSLGDYDGRTALHVACAEGHQKVVEYLLSVRADPNPKDRWEGTPLQDAVKAGNFGIAALMRSKRGRLPAKTGTEQVCDAASKGDVRQLRLLHECGVSIDAGDYDDRYPLHLAAAEARILAVSYLLSISADPNCTDRWGGRPIDDALRGGTPYHLYCAKLIMAWGGEPGTGEQIAERAEQLRKVEEIKVLSVRALIKKLIERGYDTMTPKMLAENEIMTSFESTMLHVPLVKQLIDRTEGIQELLRDNVRLCTTALDTFKTTVMHLARDLDSKKAVKNRRSGSMLNLLGTPSGALEQTLTQQCESVFSHLQSVEVGVEVLNEVDSDDELALYEEIDALVEAKERAEHAGVSGEKISAQSFQKAAMRIVEIGKTFETICIIARVAQEQTGEGGLMKPGGVDNSGEPWLSVEELGYMLELLGVESVNQMDLEELFEEGQQFQQEHGRKPPQVDPSIEKGLSKVRMLLSKAGAKEGQEQQPLVGIGSLLAGSPSFRRMMMNLIVDEDMCFLMDTRISEVCTEMEIRRLLPFGHKEVEENVVVFDASAVGQEDPANQWFVVATGECEVASLSSDAAVRSRVSYLGRGDFFGAYTALTGDPNPPFVVRSKTKCDLLVLSVSALLDTVSRAPGKADSLSHFMGEAPAPLCSTFGSLRQVRGRRLKARHQGGVLSRISERLAFSSKSQGTSASAGTGRSSPGGRRRFSFVTEEVGDRQMLVGEWEKQTVKEMVGSIHRIWSNFAMGSSSFSRQQLRLIHRLLGEVSSECFNKMFLSTKLPENVEASDYWKCWVDFLSEEVFGSGPLLSGKDPVPSSPLPMASQRGAPVNLDDTAAVGTEPPPPPPPAARTPFPLSQRKKSRAGLLKDPSTHGEDSGSLHGILAEDEPIGLLERLHARFAPSRSLKHRFFEEEVLEQYELAWVNVLGSTQHALSVDRIPAFLGKVFTDYGFRVTERNVAEFLVAFGRDKSSTNHLQWHELNRTIRDRRNGFHKHFDGRFIGHTLNPLWPPLIRWNILISLCAVYYLFLVPVRIAFLPWSSFTDREALASDLVVDCLVMVDFVVRANTAYKNRKSQWVTLRTKILRRMPLVCALAALPLDWCGHAVGASNEMAAWLRLPKMLLILACAENIRVGSKASQRRSKLVPLLQLVALTLHWSACAWFYLGRASGEWIAGAAVSWYEVDPALEDQTYPRKDLYGMEEGATVWDAYVLSLYWVSATITINGLVGDLIPQNDVEIGFTIILMVLNMTVVRWVLGEVSTIIMSADDEIVKAREELEVVDSFINGNNLPLELQTEIRSHYHSVHQGASFDQDNIYSMLSHSLQMEVAGYVAREYLDGVEILQGCSDQLLDAIAVLLREVSFSPEQWLFHEHENSKHMYVMIGGLVEEVIESEEMTVEHVIRPPGSVGELPFFFGIRHFISTRAAKTGALCLRLDKVSFMSLMKLFPEEEELVAHNAIRIMERVNKSRGTSRAGSSRGSRKSGTSRASTVKSSYSHVSSYMDGSTASSRHDKSSLVDGETSADEGSFCEEESEGGDNVTLSSQASRSDRNSDILVQLGGGSRSSKIATLKARRNTERVTALLTAAAQGSTEAMTMALERKADLRINDADSGKRTALHVAAAEGHSKAVQFLLDRGADPHLRDKHGNTPLDDAVRHRNDPTAKVIRDKVPDVVMSLKGKVAGVEMCKAGHAGNVSRLKRLIVNGIDPNEADYDGRTALHLAACEGHVSVVKFLLDSSASVDCTDRFGGTAIQDAVRHGQVEVQAVLFKAGGRLEKGGTDYAAELCEAAAEGDLETIKALTKNGADLAAGDYDGRTALHLAAANERVSVLEYILAVQPPINVNPCDRFMCTPLDDAVRHGQDTAASMLQKRGGLRRGDPALEKVLADQRVYLEKRHRRLREPMVQQSLRFSPEQRALQWLKVQLEPTMAKTVALVESMLSLVEGMRALIDGDDLASPPKLAIAATSNGDGNGTGNGHLHANGNGNGLGMGSLALETPDAHLWTRPDPGATEVVEAAEAAVVQGGREAMLEMPSPRPCHTGRPLSPDVDPGKDCLPPPLPGTPAATASMTTAPSTPRRLEASRRTGLPENILKSTRSARDVQRGAVEGEASARLQHLMATARQMLNRSVREDLQKRITQARIQVQFDEEGEQAAEGVRQRLGEIKSVLMEYMAVMDGGTGEEEGPIDCQMWKMAQRKYAAEAKELCSLLLHMGELCRFSRKLVKELIRLEKRATTRSGSHGLRGHGALAEKATAAPRTANLLSLKAEFAR